MIAVLACTASNAQAQLIAGRTNALLWGNPVSYTHLDVYKRQPANTLHSLKATTDIEIITIGCVIK